MGRREPRVLSIVILVNSCRYKVTPVNAGGLVMALYLLLPNTMSVPKYVYTYTLSGVERAIEEERLRSFDPWQRLNCGSDFSGLASR